MGQDDPREERRLQYVARAQEARVKAEESTDTAIHDWWLSAAAAWQYLVGAPNARGDSER